MNEDRPTICYICCKKWFPKVGDWKHFHDFCGVCRKTILEQFELQMKTTRYSLLKVEKQ